MLFGISTNHRLYTMFIMGSWREHIQTKKNIFVTYVKYNRIPKTFYINISLLWFIIMHNSKDSGNLHFFEWHKLLKLISLTMHLKLKTKTKKIHANAIAFEKCLWNILIYLLWCKNLDTNVLVFQNLNDFFQDADTS